MAKAVKCPMCGTKVDPNGSQYMPHYADSNQREVCLMSNRPIENRQDDGPVTDGSGPSGPTTGGTGTNVTP